MAFATVTDVETRLMRTFTQVEEDAAEYLLDAVSSEIEDAVNRLEADIDTGLDVLGVITVEAVARELSAPTGAESTSETIGSYSYSVRYSRDNAGSGGALLTAAEERRCRKAVWGTNIASVMLGSVFREVGDEVA